MQKKKFLINEITKMLKKCEDMELLDLVYILLLKNG
jgi:hypothetical protein